MYRHRWEREAFFPLHFNIPLPESIFLSLLRPRGQHGLPLAQYCTRFQLRFQSLYHFSFFLSSTNYPRNSLNILRNQKKNSKNFNSFASLLQIWLKLWPFIWRMFHLSPEYRHLSGECSSLKFASKRKKCNKQFSQNYCNIWTCMVGMDRFRLRVPEFTRNPAKQNPGRCHPKGGKKERWGSPSPLD